MFKIRVERAITLSKYEVISNQEIDKEPTYQELKRVASKHFGVTAFRFINEGNDTYGVFQVGVRSPNNGFMGYVFVENTDNHMVN